MSKRRSGQATRHLLPGHENWSYFEVTDRGDRYGWAWDRDQDMDGENGSFGNSYYQFQGQFTPNQDIYQKAFESSADNAPSLELSRHPRQEELHEISESESTLGQKLLFRAANRFHVCSFFLSL